METTEFEGVIPKFDITKLPVSITTTDVNLTGSWKFFKPIFQEKISPCSAACPSNINISKYIMYLVKGDIKTALNILRRENPLPATCGRVCPHFCQFECNREHFDSAVKIRDIERFLGDYGLDIPFALNKKNSNKSVAIIGAGPAGLSCAYFLKLHGVNVKIFEKEDKPGGILRYGIPEYRLPKNILDREIDNILKLGIDIKTNFTIDNDNIKELVNDFDAILVAIGLWEANIPEGFTIDNRYFFKGIDFLKEINSGKVITDKKIAIIGGGNVAIDVAMTIKRMNNNPTIIYRRTIKEMPAFEDEIKEAVNEKIKIIEKRVISNYKIEDNKVSLNLSKFNDTSDKNREIMEFDFVIFATGQNKSIDFTENSKIFKGGDYILGPSTVTEAIASGKRKAFEIMDFLNLNNQSDYKEEFFRSSKDFNSKDIVTFDKINTFYFKLNEKLVSQQQTSPVEEIINEAKRCFNCGICNKCGTCWFCCPDVSVEFVKELDEEINFDYEHCKGCGVCSAECPRGVIDMEEDK